MRDLLVEEGGTRAFGVHGKSSDLFLLKLRDGASLIETVLRKSIADKEAMRTNQGVPIGELEPLYDVEATMNLRVANPWHARCLGATKDSMVGMGFEDEQVHDVLDPLCQDSSQALLEETADDFASVHMAAIEVVRKGDVITGLHHIPINSIKKVMEENRRDFHFVMDSIGADPPRVVFARYGDKDDFLRRSGIGDDPDITSEVIFFRRANSIDSHYGFPDWIPSVAYIELVQMYVQQRFDFYHNGAVPGFVLSFMGGGSKIDDETWTSIENMIRSTVGIGNHYKALAINLPHPDITMQLEKLALESADGGSNMSDVLDPNALAIVSAHGVPPLLAGIQIPGKLGANNELPNALMTFQLLRIGPMQRAIATRLACTLGDPKTNGGLPLTRENFLPKRDSTPDTPAPGMPPVPEHKRERSTGFVKITDMISMQALSTQSQMREPAAAAQEKGRNLNDGLKE